MGDDTRDEDIATRAGRAHPVNRAKAERAVAASNLPMADTLVMLQLLRRAHNDTLELPDWITPSLRVLAAEARLGTKDNPDVRRLRRILRHLQMHGWLKYIPGLGRTNKSTYLLLPDGVVPDDCACVKKGGPTTPLLQREKGSHSTQKRGQRKPSSRRSETVRPPRYAAGGRLSAG